jgi:hypothetical protein
MVSLKYAKEYRLDTFTDERGKVKDCTVYIGPLYEWVSSKEQLKKTAWLLTLMTMVQSFLLVFSLWNYSDLTKLWWVVLPFSCILFVCLYLGMVCYNLFTVKGQFHREQKDKTIDRMKSSSVMGMIFAGTTAMSAFTSLFLDFIKIGVWDIFFVVADMTMIVLFILEFRMAGNLEIREVPNPETDKWKDK